MKETPNILLITTDTSRCDTLHCMGSEFAVSPYLDKLASEGVLFTEAHTSSPVCMPARCSLMSGLHTYTHGCIENGLNRRENIPMLSDSLEEQGYRNIMVGKTHFGKVPDSFHVKHDMTGDKTDGKHGFYGEYLDFLGDLAPFAKAPHPTPIPEEKFIDSFLVDTTIKEIQNHVDSGTKQPFFAFCSLISPHGPVTPPSPWDSLFDEIDLPPVNYCEGEEENLPLHYRSLGGLLLENEKLTGKKIRTIRDYTPEEIEIKRKLYYGFAAYCDAQIGRLIDFIDSKGLKEETLVIFSSDHGTTNFDHGFGNKHNYFDPSWHIPLIMRYPGCLPAGETRDFAIWNDISATILSAAGADPYWVQGFDVLEPLSKGKPSPRNHAIATLYKSAALATKRWKLEYYFEEDEGRLYDRIKDSEEQNNLYESPAHQTVRNELRHALTTWCGDLQDVAYLRRNTNPSGPVAKRIARSTFKMRGADSEVRLNQKVLKINQLDDSK